MPIYTSADEKPKDTVIIHFGFGDIAMAPAKIESKLHCDELFLVQHSELHPIGSYTKEYEGKNSNEVEGPQVRLVFENLECLDVLLERLTKLRAIMEAQNDEVEYQDPPGEDMTPPGQLAKAGVTL